MPTPSIDFSWPLRVYYEDTDAQGVVYYANYFNFMERARTEWIRSLGIEQDALLRDHRRMFVVVDLQAQFRKPAKFNDELLVTASLKEAGRASFVIEQHIFRGQAAGEALCSGAVRAAYLNADTFRPCKLPGDLFERN